LALPVGSIDDNKAQQIAHSGGLKVLIAEDNTINMALVKFILAKILPDALPIEAVNGVEAVNKYRVYMPDLVLMDMQMPEMDGLEATRTIRQMEQELDRRVPILALTANAMSGERENCLNAGMDDYLTKPLQQKLLTDMLKRHLITGTQHIKN
jgi:CheY-like chemotaxis protein